MKCSVDNSVFRPYPRDRTIHSFFEDMAAENPNRIAVEFGDEHITYGDLNESANKLATVLIQSDIAVGDVVAISAERSINMVIAIIGILKSGAAYLPVDPNIPAERQRYYMETAKAKMLLSEQDDDILLGVRNINIHKIPQDILTIYNTEIPSNTLAYIIFTSGSTGKPKGVMIRHYSVVNRLLWMKSQYGLCEKDVFIQKTPFSFDVSVWELFLWFFCGAKLCLLKTGYEGNIEYLLDVISTHKVTACHFVPSMLRVFLEYLAHRNKLEKVKYLKNIFSSGEALQYDTVTYFNQLFKKKHATRLHNLYGPTEATVDVAYFDCTGYQSEDRVIPIGKPIWNTNLYILDNNGCECADGEKGELYISGDGVALGYINNTELTQKVFISDPFHQDAVMYKTGDIAQRRHGNIEFLGRIDNQVQIHGIRIEPEEIEHLLISHELITQSVVVAAGDDEKKLIAYYTGKENVPSSLLTNYLTSKLPKFMIPVEYIFLRKFPLTPNGKIDRKQLENLFINKVAPIDKCCETLSIIRQVIGRDVDMDDDFTQSDIDSITFIGIVVALESAFHFEFDDEKLLITEFPKIKSIVKYVESKIEL